MATENSGHPEAKPRTGKTTYGGGKARSGTTQSPGATSMRCQSHAGNGDVAARTKC